jgi:myo-inositol-1-phosphate synthase
MVPRQGVPRGRSKGAHDEEVLHVRVDGRELTMSAPTGVWLVGARGSVATTAMVGALSLRAGLTDATGLVSALPQVAAAGLPEIGDLVFGGHDLGTVPLPKRAEGLAGSGVLPASLLSMVHEDLAEVEGRLRRGLDPSSSETQGAAIERVAADIVAFRDSHGLARVVVVDVASTEPPVAPVGPLADLDELEDALAAGEAPLPASSAYALAAYRAGCALVSFTPSPGPRLPAVQQAAERAGLPWAGSDGKTGETLVKSALAPMFADRALRVRSWASYNMLGGGDGANLADPVAASSKTASKRSGLEAILGHPVDGPMHIDYVADHGDWKTAMDHVSFEGFLGVRMTMQFTWSGCDSALAAPLVLDLVRLMARAHEAGRSGPQEALGFFFKDPAGSGEHRLAAQFDALVAWCSELGQA